MLLVRCKVGRDLKHAFVCCESLTMSFTALCKLCFALLISLNSHADNRESHEENGRGD